MTAERWRRIEALYHAARARHGEDQSAFLDSACEGDESLRREVSSLLAQPVTEDPFLAESALTVAAQLVTSRSLTGSRLGVYEVQALLGVGGMGEVYRARDTRLDRDVAIKVLPEPFGSDADYVARFKREAKTLASLNHPNIGAIYGLEQIDGVDALVLELVEGPTLADCIARDRLSSGEALLIAKQIADALEAAHDAGVIHRDLKPANVKVRPDGTVKILDFGIAKRPGPSADQHPASLLGSNTFSASTGVVGTAAYMSPEQADGQPADRRIDIWAFGCVLFEMLSGRQAFGDATGRPTFAQARRSEPDWDALPPKVPHALSHLLKRCLTPEIGRRLPHIGDANRELIRLISANPPSRPDRRGPLRWAFGIAGLVAAGVGVIWVVHQVAASSNQPAVRRSEILTRDAQVIPPLGGRQIALSRDGTRLAYIDSSRLNVRNLVTGTDLNLTVGAADTFDAASPFFSFDGEWLAYSKTDLEAISLGGEATPRVLCQESGIGGGTWGGDGTIVFSDGTSLWTTRVGERECRQLAIDLRSGTGATRRVRSPQFLPGATTLLVELSEDQVHSAAVVSRATGEMKVLVPDATNPRYLPTGHLVFLRGQRLFAAPFDVGALELRGDARPVLDDVSSDALGHIDFADEGTVAYVPVSRGSEFALVWVDRDGHEDRIGLRPDTYWVPRLSPEADRLAVTLRRPSESRFHIDVIDLSSGDHEIVSEGIWPAWMPDGRRIAFTGYDFDLWLQPPGRTDLRQSLLTPALGVRDALGARSSVRPVVVAFETSDSSTTDIAVRAVDPPGKPTVLVATTGRDVAPSLSPDAKYLVYASDVSRASQIYVRTCPPCRPELNLPDRTWQVSTTGGSAPLWSRDGQEIFYLDGSFMNVVSVRTSPTFEYDSSQHLFDVSAYIAEQFAVPNYDARADGRRFVMVKRGNSDDTRHRITVVFNWFQELPRRVPAK